MLKIKQLCNDLKFLKNTYKKQTTEVDALMNKLYSKKFNVLIQQNVWETTTESGKQEYDFVSDALLFKNPEAIKLVDVHRNIQHLKLLEAK